MPKCRFCPATPKSHRELRSHCELSHPDDFAKVMGWLAKTMQPKLETFEKLAEEGMLGAKEGKPAN